MRLPDSAAHITERPDTRGVPGVPGERFDSPGHELRPPSFSSAASAEQELHHHGGGGHQLEWCRAVAAGFYRIVSTGCSCLPSSRTGSGRNCTRLLSGHGFGFGGHGFSLTLTRAGAASFGSPRSSSPTQNVSGSGRALITWRRPPAGSIVIGRSRFTSDESSQRATSS